MRIAFWLLPLFVVVSSPAIAAASFAERAVCSAARVACEPAEAEPELPVAAPDELLDRLAEIPGLTVVEEQLSPAPGFRFLILTYTQPVDHRQPERGTFEQTLTLLHHSFAAPVVAYTTGYELFLEPFRSEPAALIDGNQLGIEERFFGSSFPEPADYRDVNIYQAAADHHRVIEAIRALYPGRWLSTGTSKGGMATVYHRRFFPGDLDGSIAYVAPNDVDNDADAYDDFFAQVGDDPACRERLWNVQRQALMMREEIAPWMAELVADAGCTLEGVSSADAAFELLVVTLDWYFWQNLTQADCALVPGIDAYPYEILDYVGASSLLWACDWVLATSSFTYQYQARTQLGWPARSYPQLLDLLRYPELQLTTQQVPATIATRFEPAAMRDIDDWVHSEGSELMFIYGENDPWGAEPFTPGPGTRDSHWYSAPGTNHGASIAHLPAAEQLHAANVVRRWAGLPPFGVERSQPVSGNAVLDALFESALDETRPEVRRGPLP